MKQKIVRWLKTYLLHEIEIDFKACTYFFCVTFFYCAVELLAHRREVKILTLGEILAVNYLICYVQTYLFHDFDESDRFGRSEWIGIGVCTALYVLASLLFGWFGKSVPVTVCYAGFVVLCYICVMLCYMVKRKLETRRLNHMLAIYKQHETKEGSHECGTSHSDVRSE